MSVWLKTNELHFLCLVTITDIWQTFVSNLLQTSWWEFVGVIAGIVGVYFSKKENILLYPLGLINTTIYVYLSFKYQLLGEGVVNFYYTIMNIYGWIVWSRKTEKLAPELRITYSTTANWLQQLAFFAAFYLAFFFSLTYLKRMFFEGAIPWADSFASATAFTAMWLMTRKKVESWWWWIATNISSIPLYFVKGLVFTSVQYLVLLFLAIAGLLEWQKRAKEASLKQG